MNPKASRVSVPSVAVHWDQIYAARGESELGWFQATPRLSLELMQGAGLRPSCSVIDVGAGASRLVDTLLDQGIYDITLLDASDAALAQTRRRLGTRAAIPQYLIADVAAWRPSRSFDFWHDRAVFHFLVDLRSRRAYREALLAALPPGGHAVIATFAPDGPERCSGLPVTRYSPDTLAAALAPGVRLVDSRREDHRTPRGALQRFQYSCLLRL